MQLIQFNLKWFKFVILNENKNPPTKTKTKNNKK